MQLKYLTPNTTRNLSESEASPTGIPTEILKESRIHWLSASVARENEYFKNFRLKNSDDCRIL